MLQRFPDTPPRSKPPHTKIWLARRSWRVRFTGIFGAYPVSLRLLPEAFSADGTLRKLLVGCPRRPFRREPSEQCDQRVWPDGICAWTDMADIVLCPARGSPSGFFPSRRRNLLPAWFPDADRQIVRCSDRRRGPHSTPLHLGPEARIRDARTAVSPLRAHRAASECARQILPVQHRIDFLLCVAL